MRVLARAAVVVLGGLLGFSGCEGCAPLPITIGGQVEGLRGSGLTLRSGAETLAIAADGTFTFPAVLQSGDAYLVEVASQPQGPSQTCTVTAGSGTATAAITSVRVRCVTDRFHVGGTVTGLQGAGLVLALAGGETLPVASDGAFTFPTALESGSSYAVSVQAQPAGPTQVCAVDAGTGTVGAADVTAVAVQCQVSAFTVGGTATGLEGTAVLRDNGGDDLQVTGSGSFTFATPVASGQPYAITIATQPQVPSQTCTLSEASGTVTTGAVTTVGLSCTTDRFAIGGAVTGLRGSGLVLGLGAQRLPVASAGSFAFPTALASGAAWEVTIAQQPTSPSQTCSLARASGVVGAAPVTTVSVSCITDTFTLGGTVSGLAGQGLVLRSGAGEDLPVSTSGAFTFPTRLESGASYSVAVHAQPSLPSQTCTVTGGTGTVGAGAVTTVAVACTTNRYAIRGSVTGLSGTGLVLASGADRLPVASNGSFAFPTTVASGATFAVSVTTQPGSPSQTCTVSGGTGTVGAADVSSVVVNCATNRYTVGGTIGGLASSVVLTLNGSTDATVSSNGTFSFGTTLLSGAAYAVTVKTQPVSPWQTCAVTGGTGSVTSSPITSVSVTCTTNTYLVGGTVTGLTGTGLVLQDNGGDDLAVTAAGAFTFSTRVASGAHYAVTVKTQPGGPAQTCVVGAGSGTVAGAPVTTVAVTCATNLLAVGGAVSGLLGAGLVLQDNGGDDLAIASDGTFTFLTPVASGATYAVTVRTQPSSPWQTCVVSGGTGTVADVPITTVSVNCTVNHYTVGGTVTGLTGSGLVLQDNAGDDLPVSASGAFTFPSSLLSGHAYAVTVKSQPASPWQTCVVTGGAGTVAGANVTGVAVACTTNRYSVGGTVTGLTGAGLQLRNNGGDTLTVAAGSTSFTFPTTIPSGGGYLVTVHAPPAGPTQTCTVSSGASGTVVNGNVTSVAVTCITNSYTVGVTVSGLAGSGLTLTNNGGGDLPVAADGAYTFSSPVLSGATYAVAVKSQPTSPWQTCAVTAGSGTMGGANVTVTVACTTNRYPVGGTVSGLTGTGLVLQDNAGDDLTVSSAGAFTFATTVASGHAYAVTVKTNPTSPWQTCTVTSGGSGTVAGAAVTTVAVTCTTNGYTVGGTVSGLAGSGLTLTDNGGGDLPVGNGPFTFAAPVASGAPYLVAVKTQPASPWQTCTVTGGSGTMGGANVTTVAVACTTNRYAVGGTVAGLTGSGLQLRNNGGDTLAVPPGSGTFTFPGTILSGGAYLVTVFTQPTSPSQTCTVASGSGTVGGANVTSVAVTCLTNPYSVGGTVSGLAGSGLVLQDNGVDNRTISANGPYTFARTFNAGDTYSVAVLTQPTSPSQTCAVANPTGTLAGSVSNVDVVCTTNTYTVGGNVTGLAGSGLTLRNNGGDDLPISASGSFTFPTRVASGAPYAVTVGVSPTSPWQTCTVTNGSGTVTAGAVASVAVACATDSYGVSATVEGLQGTGLVLQNNGGQNKAVAADGLVTFTPQLSGTPYAITVLTEPTAPVQACFVRGGSGTVAGAPVVAQVICAPRTCAERKAATPTEPDGAYYIDPDGTGPLAPIQVWCDHTTDGGGWTLLAWLGNPFAIPNGVPYPGLAYCAGLNCSRGSGVPPTHVAALLHRSTEFGQGQSPTGVKATFGALGTYDFAGKYTYPSLAAAAPVYGPNSCNPATILTGTYTGIVAGGATATVHLDVGLTFNRSPSTPEDYGADANTYLWSVGDSNAVPCQSMGISPPPTSFLGTFAGPQYGPAISNTSASYSVWVR